MKLKTITINSDKDYKKFIKKIYLYKSILYINTFFKVNNKTNNKDIEYIIYALNIKKRKKRIEYIYNFACDLIDNKFKGINICGFKNGKCHVQQKTKKNCNGCCRKCLYQSEHGCKTKNLACKLFNCSEVTSRYNVIKYEDLKILKLLSFKNQMIIKSDYFSKYEDVLKDLYSYSLTYSLFRMTYRLIKNYIIFSILNKKNNK